MTHPPCKNCQRPIFTDGEDFWKWDEESGLFRTVDYTNEFYPIDTHPGITEQQLVVYVGKDLRLATEADIIWRTVNMVLEGLATMFPGVPK
jgi:hypothetical protein